MMRRVSPYQAATRRALVNEYLIVKSAHTPKPEKMFEALIRKGIVSIRRRRGKPPLLVFEKDV